MMAGAVSAERCSTSQHGFKRAGRRGWIAPAARSCRLGLLDWLAVRGKAARPARVPVAFKLADNATEHGARAAPRTLQADVDGASVVFETENDVKLVAVQARAG